MKKTKITVSILLLVFATATVSWAQPTLRCWRIVNGPGAGITLTGSGGNGVDDHYYGANGFIAEGHFTDCECFLHDGHYHGVLFGENDPDADHCGWGCVDEIPCSPELAADALQDTIDDIYDFVDPYLGTKLQKIFDKMGDAAYYGCYSVLDALSGAFAEEIRSYFLVSNNMVDFNGADRAMVEYVSSTLSTLSYSNPVPVISMNGIKLFRRLGTGSNSRLFDPGVKITVPVGQLFSLEAYGDGSIKNPIIRWSPRWKGEATGEVPDGAATSYMGNRISVLSQKPTSLKLNVWTMYPNKKTAKDAITINFTPF